MRYLVLFTVVIVAVALIAGTALAGHGGYHLDWWTVDGGGAVDMQSGDGAYTLSGTAGQPDAGTLESSDGSYTLSGGFWAGERANEHNIFIPVVLK